MLLMYQIKVGLCLIAFYLLWKLLLSRETFHRFNRVTLLVVMVLAMVLPWIQFTIASPTPVANPIVMLEELIITPASAAQPEQVNSFWNIMNIANVLYFIGVALVAAWLLHSQWSLHRLLRKGRKELLPGGITLHIVPGDQAPFSYFKHIVINEQDYQGNQREILAHEQAHIRLGHSWDVLFIELMTMLLIKKSVGDQLFSMANNFNYQSLKKRIRMMTINKSSRLRQLRALAVVPVTALALLAFANPTTETADELVVVAYNEPEVSQDVYESVEQMPEFPGGQAEMMKYLAQNIHYPANAAKNNVEGRVVLQFVIEKDGRIGEVKIARSVDPELDAEALRVVKSMPNFIPGRQDGKPVAVWYTIPISFKLQGEPQKQEGE